MVNKQEIVMDEVSMLEDIPTNNAEIISAETVGEESLIVAQNRIVDKFLNPKRVDTPDIDVDFI